MTRNAPSLLDEALRAAIRAELDALFEEKLKPLLEDRPNVAAPTVRGPLYVSTTDAAKIVGVTVGTIQAWVRQDRLRGYRAGRLLRIKVEDLHAFMTRAPAGEVVDLEAVAQRIMLAGGRRSPSR
jgi:excisionase family DNA binding protein